MIQGKKSYRLLHEQGILKERIEAADAMLRECTVCPRLCKVDRYDPENRGTCRTNALPVVSAYHPHFGEEPPLVGLSGSGTIFFTSCNLHCVFCQNWEISHERVGEEVIHRRLGRMMVELQAQGCHNINFVTPSHMVPQILASLPYAIEMGLRIPLVYNTSGYDRVETLKLLEGIVEIYMPDIKYADPAHARRYSAAADYPETAREAIREMHRQVGNLVIDRNGLAPRGLLVRHWVMPGEVAGTREVMRFLAREISPDTYVNLMDQYHPAGITNRYPEINRRISPGEFEAAIAAAREEGIHRFAWCEDA